MQWKGIERALVRDFEDQVRKKGGITVWLGSDDENGSTTISGIDVYPDVLKHIARIRNIKRHPELVDINELDADLSKPNIGVIGRDPRTHASKELGQRILDRFTKVTEDFIKDTFSTD